MNMLILFLILAADEKPVPKVPVGKDTTVVTGPLTKEGYIDYEAALNERLGKGITPEKNANVLIWNALGPKPEGGKGMPAHYFKLMGTEEPPEKGDYFVGFDSFLRHHLKLAGEEIDAVIVQQESARQRPWSGKDYPYIARWLAINEKPLALAIEASKRPDYFNPLATHQKEKQPGALMACLLPSVQKCRELGVALIARAMLRVHEGNRDPAWQDLLACHRLARLVSRGGTLIEALVGLAIDRMASDAELAYLENAKPTAEQIRGHLKDLQALPPFPPLLEKIDLGERYFFLDCMQMVRRGGIGTMEALSGGELRKPDEEEQKALNLIDWTPAFRNGNMWYDRLVKAMREKDRAEQEKQLNKIDEEMRSLKTEQASPSNLMKLLMTLDPETAKDKAIGKTIGDVLIALMMPAVRKVNTAAERGEQTQRNLHTAFALAAYRADTGRYPAMLDDLAPKYLPTVPNDLFADKPLIYRPSENGYLLYSVGPNGKDEEGRTTEDEPRGDDIRVRMPLDKPK